MIIGKTGWAFLKGQDRATGEIRLIPREIRVTDVNSEEGMIKIESVISSGAPAQVVPEDVFSATKGEAVTKAVATIERRVTSLVRDMEYLNGLREEEDPEEEFTSDKVLVRSLQRVHNEIAVAIAARKAELAKDATGKGEIEAKKTPLTIIK